jgi:Outer membrane receptor for ferric coprogen and ferric-rhodotorulic acid
MYVPKHQFHINANYNWKKWNVYWQNRWIDRVFTQTDNQKSLPSYWTSNVGIGYEFNAMFRTQFTVNNIFDHAYQSIENRYMPGINYQLSINIKL